MLQPDYIWTLGPSDLDTFADGLEPILKSELMIGEGLLPQSTSELASSSTKLRK